MCNNNNTKLGTGYCLFCIKGTEECTCIEDTTKQMREEFTKKFIYTSDLRHYLQQYYDEEITFSRLVEMINQKAYKFYNNDKTETK